MIWEPFRYRDNGQLVGISAVTCRCLGSIQKAKQANKLSYDHMTIAACLLRQAWPVKAEARKLQKPNVLSLFLDIPHSFISKYVVRLYIE